MVIKKIKFSSALAASLLFSLNVSATPFKPVTTLSDGQTPQTQAKPIIKIGSEYKIEGVTYTPREKAEYDSVGIASWYGEEFQGKLTANGEVFDMEEVTAAHHTLKLPSVVEVTNLDNGKKIIVRVNDRGPFSGGRIIDLSKRAAELLGFKDQGTARVRVTLLDDISKQAVAEMKNTPASTSKIVDTELSKNNIVDNNPAINNASVEGISNDNLTTSPSDVSIEENTTSPIETFSSTEELSSNGTPELTPISLVEPSSVKSYIPRGVFVQIGAFSNDNDHIKDDVNSLSDVGVVSLQKVDINGKNILRLRVGPYGSVDDAVEIKNRLIKLGYTESRVVIEQ